MNPALALCVVVRGTFGFVALVGTPHPLELPPCATNPNVPRTVNDRDPPLPRVPDALLRVSTMRQGWIGWKIVPTSAGVTASAETKPAGGPFGAEGSAGEAADAEDTSATPAISTADTAVTSVDFNRIDSPLIRGLFTEESKHDLV